MTFEFVLNLIQLFFFWFKIVLQYLTGFNYLILQIPRSFPKAIKHPVLAGTGKGSRLGSSGCKLGSNRFLTLLVLAFSLVTATFL